MNIREATPDDNQRLQELQAKCPQGKTLIVSIINMPDFFGRAKAYEDYKVYVACEDDQIIGSAACAVREAGVNGKPNRVGYEFQYFISPSYRGRGVAKQIHREIEDHLLQNGAVLSYLLVMGGNSPAMRLFEGQGFKLHRTLVMPGLPLYKKMEIPSKGKLRSVMPRDLTAVAMLLNDTWRGYDLYEPTSAEALAQFINRTPAYRFENLILLEDRGEISACLGFWDWRQVMRITVVKRSLKMRMIGMLLDFLRNFRPMPRRIKEGDTLKQMILTPIAFKDPGHLAVLIRYLNNQALQEGIEQIFCVCERDHVLLSAMKGFVRIDTTIYLYVKPLQQNVSMGNIPVFIDGIDL
jgi:GNAT superfamily N-acetyltransferase